MCAGLLRDRHVSREIAHFPILEGENENEMKAKKAAGATDRWLNVRDAPAAL